MKAERGPKPSGSAKLNPPGQKRGQEIDESAGRCLAALSRLKRIQGPEKSPGVDVVMLLSMRVSALEAFQSRHQFEIGRNRLDRFRTDRAAVAGEGRSCPVDSLGHPNPVTGHVARLGAGRDEQRLDRLGLPDPVVEVGNPDRRVEAASQSSAFLVPLTQPCSVARRQIAAWLITTPRRERA
jgi:hypothetical protein